MVTFAYSAADPAWHRQLTVGATSSIQADLVLRIGLEGPEVHLLRPGAGGLLKQVENCIGNILRAQVLRAGTGRPAFALTGETSFGNAARQNCRHADIEIAHFSSQGLRQPMQPKLTGAIGGHIGIPLLASAGRNHDDMPAALLFHRRQHGLRAEKWTSQVDIQRALPLFYWRVFHNANWTTDARVVDQHIDPAKALQRLRGDTAGIGRLGNIGVQRHADAIGGSNLGDQPVHISLGASDGYHAGALTGKRQSNNTPSATPGASNNSHLIL